jgi:hypothetical protein
MQQITMADYLMGRADFNSLTDALKDNAAKTVAVANAFLAEFGEYRKVNSGYRRPQDNAAANGAAHSKHMECAAIDLEDKDGRLKAFATEEILEKFGVYAEAFSSTPSWLHIQILAPKSGHRVFFP